MRLIDADALKDAMYHEAFETDTVMQKWDSGCWIRYKLFENAIDSAPTIEQKHGKWIKISDRNYKCSVCGAWWTVDRDSTMKDFAFCPSCGARMERRGENEN